MRQIKQVMLGKLLPSAIIILFFFLLGYISAGYPSSGLGQKVVYAEQEVTILTKQGAFAIEAMFDTGASRSSIHKGLAKLWALEQDFGPFDKTGAGSNRCRPEEVFVKSAIGTECRIVVKIAYEITTIDGTIIVGDTTASVADRERVYQLLLMGRPPLKKHSLLVSSNKNNSSE